MLHFWLAVIFPIIGGAFAVGFFNIAKRYINQSGKVSPLQFLIWLFGIATLIFALFYGLRYGLTLPQVLPGFWVAVIGVTIPNIFIQFFNAKAASIDQGEVSLTAPLQALTPGFITALAIIVGEYPGTIGIIGIIIMAAGSYVLLFEKTPKKWYHYFMPLSRAFLLFRLRGLSQEERNKTIVITLALGSACMGTIGLIFDGLYTRRGITLQGLTLGAMVETALLTGTYLMWHYIFPGKKQEARTLEIPRLCDSLILFLQKHFLILLLLPGIFWVLHVYLTNPAYHMTLIAYVGTLKRFQILVTVILGFILFKEKDFKKRVFAASLIIIGAILISMDDLPGRVSTGIEKFGF